MTLVHVATFLSLFPRIEVGLSDENNVDHVSVTLKTALNKLKNVIILQKGFGEALCYCNDERHSLQRNGDQRDWFFIKKNCEPTDIVIVSTRPFRFILPCFMFTEGFSFVSDIILSVTCFEGSSGTLTGS